MHQSRARRMIDLPANGGVPATIPEQTQPVVSENDRVAGLAEAVRDLFCVCVRARTGDTDYGTRDLPNWDGGEGRYGTRHKNVWPKIAATIVTVGADPVEYIHAQFAIIKTGIPRPSAMHGARAVAIWQRFAATALNRAHQRVTSDLNQLKTVSAPLRRNLGWKEADAIDYALRDKSCTCSPLVKYCVALANDLELAEYVHDDALSQYVFQMEHYDKTVLRDMIPDEFRKAAASLRNKMLGM